MNEAASIIKNIFTGITGYFGVKFIPSILIPIFGVLFGFENNLILRAILLLVIIEFVLGMALAFRAAEPTKRKAERASKSAFKLAIYGLLISAGHLTEQITPGTTFIEEAITTFLGLTELILILESTGKLGFAVPQQLLVRIQSWRDGGSNKDTQP